MTPKQLFDAGRVREAQQALAAHLRNRPDDIQARSFLFELLCFSGDYERAEKQLGVLADSNEKTKLGAVLYYSALHAEKSRHQLYKESAFPQSVAPAEVKGTLNGKPFSTIRDADPDLGARLEVYAAGAYLWIPFAHLSSVRMEAPTKLRDTLWVPAFAVGGEALRERDLGEVLLPAIYPFSWRHPDESIWLGRGTEYSEDENGTRYPEGQKILIVDGEEVPFLEIRTLEIEQAAAGDSAE